MTYADGNTPEVGDEVRDITQHGLLYIIFVVMGVRDDGMIDVSPCRGWYPPDRFILVHRPATCEPC